MILVLFSCLITLARASSKTLSNEEERGISALFPVIVGRGAVSLLPFGMFAFVFWMY